MPTICERGTMMSRTCVSATSSTPLIIDSASASMIPRSLATRRSSISRSRSRGSLPLPCVRRRNHRPVVLWGSSLIRVGIAQTPEYSGLPAFHAPGFVGLFVIIPEQVQGSVHDHVRPVLRQRLVLLARLAGDDRGTHHQVAE